MAKCIVLRNSQAGSFNPQFGTASRGVNFELTMASPPIPTLEIAEANSRERSDLARDPAVVAVTPAMPTKLIAPVRNAKGVKPSAIGDAWGVAAVGADVSSSTGAGTVVCVLDTGIDRNHEAFNGVNITEEDFSGDGTGDVQGHGTHCAGTIFGRDVDGARIGVAPGVTDALIGKVLTNSGSGSSEALFQGMQWAADNGAQVISMSLGFDFPGLVANLISQGMPAAPATSTALEAYRGNLRMFDAIMDMIRAREAFGTGTVVVAAAGNEASAERLRTMKSPSPCRPPPMASSRSARWARLPPASKSRTFPIHSRRSPRPGLASSRPRPAAAPNCSMAPAWPPRTSPAWPHSGGTRSGPAGSRRRRAM